MSFVNQPAFPQAQAFKTLYLVTVSLIIGVVTALLSPQPPILICTLFNNSVELNRSYESNIEEH